MNEKKKYSLLLVSNLLISTTCLYAGRGDYAAVPSAPTPAAPAPVVPSAPTPAAPAPVPETSSDAADKTGKKPKAAVTPAVASTASNDDSNNNDIALEAGGVIGGLGLATGVGLLAKSKISSNAKERALDKKAKEFEKKKGAYQQRNIDVVANFKGRTEELKTYVSEVREYLNFHYPENSSMAEKMAEQQQGILQDFKSPQLSELPKIREKINDSLAASVKSLSQDTPKEVKDFLITSHKALMDHVNSVDPEQGHKVENALKIPGGFIDRIGDSKIDPYSITHDYMADSRVNNKDVSKVTRAGSKMHEDLSKEIEKASKAWFYKEKKLKAIQEKIQQHINDQAEQLPLEKPIHGDMTETEAKEAQKHNDIVKSAKKSIVESGLILNSKLNEKLSEKKINYTSSVVIPATIHTEHITETHIHTRD